MAAWRRVDGTRPVVIFEAVGVPGMLDICMRMAPRGTRITVVGACLEADTVRPMIGLTKELSLQFVFGYEPHEFAGSLLAIAEGKVDLEPIITGTVTSTASRRPSTTWPTRTPTPRSWSSRDRHLPPPVRQHPAVHPGRAEDVTVSPDGRRVVFVRSRGGNDPVNCLWVLDLDAVTGAGGSASSPIRACCCPARTTPTCRRQSGRGGNGPGRAPAGSSPTPPTRRCRRRVRPRRVGCSWPGWCRRRRASCGRGPGVRPPTDPTASRLAYVGGPSLRVAELDGTSRELVGRGRPGISWGSAEFVAAEEMGRTRGYWWAPDGSRHRRRAGRRRAGGPLVDRRPRPS